MGYRLGEFCFRNSRGTSWDPYSPRENCHLPASFLSFPCQKVLTWGSVCTVGQGTWVWTAFSSAHPWKAQRVRGSKWIKDERSSTDYKDSESKMRSKTLRASWVWPFLQWSSSLQDTPEVPRHLILLSQWAGSQSHWHLPKYWEESREWNCRTLATTSHWKLLSGWRRVRLPVVADSLSTGGI